ncbi:MAG: hypothetical protein KDB73_08670 [Planctomycetes bacterium]|nr:hypothetical protein [Planctomycetota bacterium]
MIGLIASLGPGRRNVDATALVGRPGRNDPRSASCDFIAGPAPVSNVSDRRPDDRVAVHLVDHSQQLWELNLGRA